jgi:hypothetical protein
MELFFLLITKFMFQQGQESLGTSIVCPHDLSLSIIHNSKPYKHQLHRKLYASSMLHFLLHQFGWNSLVHHKLNLLSPVTLVDGRPRMMLNLTSLLEFEHKYSIISY